MALEVLLKMMVGVGIRVGRLGLGEAVQGG